MYGSLLASVIILIIVLLLSYGRWGQKYLPQIKCFQAHCSKRYALCPIFIFKTKNIQTGFLILHFLSLISPTFLYTSTSHHNVPWIQTNMLALLETLYKHSLVLTHLARSQARKLLLPHRLHLIVIVVGQKSINIFLLAKRANFERTKASATGNVICFIFSPFA